MSCHLGQRAVDRVRPRVNWRLMAIELVEQRLQIGDLVTLGPEHDEKVEGT